MSDIILIGINHKTAPVALREALAFTDEEIRQALKIIHESPEIKEVLIFSTCNRMEALFMAESESGIDFMKTFIADFKDISLSDFENTLYIHRGTEAVRHIFRVASSLDSMIIGEPQILGQVKTAYKTTVTGKTSGVILNRLMHKAFSIAKKVRRETGIGDNAVSISYAAIELAGKIFSDISTKHALLLGAGEMAELAVEHLISHGVKKITLANRTFCNAVSLSEKFNGKAVRFEEREALLEQVDIIISSTGATEYVLTAEVVKKKMRKRKNRPLFFIDIAVPRDIDPKIHEIDNAYLYDIDDLQNIVDDNMDERQKEALKGERLVEEAVIKFQRWMDGLSVVPTIVDIKKKIESIAEAEAKKTLLSLNLSFEDEQAIHRMTRAITSKIMHDPILFLKNTGSHRDDSMYLSAARNMFNLDNGD